jgi:hypothetical protein
MRKTALGLVLAAVAGSAAAGDLADRRDYDANDYSAQVYYRVDFGGVRGQAPSVGLRFDNERAAAAGAPSLLQASFGAQGVQRVALSGVDLRGAMLSANEGAGGGFFSSLSASQWIALGFTVLVFGTVAVDATESTEPDVAGTGGS